MPNKFYDKYDEATQVKLELFGKYVREWFPVFMKLSSIERIQIIDFFCGEGQDEEGNPGSPSKILKEINSYYTDHEDEFDKKQIEIIFNDKEPQCIEKLQINVSDMDIADPIKDRIKYQNKDFMIYFEEIYPALRDFGSAKLLFLDQFGVGKVTDAVFKKLFALPKTDFLFFCASSSIKRFFDQEEFQEVSSWMDREEIRSSPSERIHQEVANQYKRLAPKDSYVVPFSMKKKTNIYGLIFCTKHIRAADKYLKILWNIDKISGEASFDINDDLSRQLDLWKVTKVKAFEKELQDKVLAESIKDNIAAYKFAIENGFLAAHAKKAIKDLEDSEQINLNGQLVLSYDSCITKGKKIQFRMVGEN